MKNDYTRIVMILDRSGSMDTIRQATMDGFNQFVGEQKQQSGECRLKLVRFNNEVETVFDHPIADVPKLTGEMFFPYAGTALFDAQGIAIVELGRELHEQNEFDRPSKVIVVTLTDGLENASRHYNREQVESLIREQREKYGWQFIFLGANQDAVKVGQTMGYAQNASVTYAATPRGMESMMSSVAANVSAFRSLDGSRGIEFSAQQRAEAVEDLVIKK